MRNANFFHLSVYMQTEIEEELESVKEKSCLKKLSYSSLCKYKLVG